MRANGTKQGWREHVRLTWAIAAKDIVDAVKNRTTIMVILATIVTSLMGQALPFFLNLSGQLGVVVYDPGGSRLVEALRESEGIRLRVEKSPAALEMYLVDLNTKALGIVVPADFDDALASGDVVQVDGYVAWSKRLVAREMAANFEREAAELLGQPVRVELDDHIVYPSADVTGTLGMAAGTLVMVIFIVGGFIVPHLMIEEKRTRTMDALLVSPATIGQVVAGKTVAGAFYCLVAAGVALAFQWTAVVHWDLVLAAIALGTLFVVALGLWMGTLFEDAQQMGFWMAIPLGAMFVSMFLSEIWVGMPEALGYVIHWLPTTALARVFWLSFAGGATMAQALPELGVLLGYGAVLCGLVIWQVRRMDR